jgi:hypothetical protein
LRSHHPLFIASCARCPAFFSKKIIFLDFFCAKCDNLTMNPLPTDQEIREWLAQKVGGNQKDQVLWLANKMSATPGTVKNWLFDTSKTILPHNRAHIARIMRDQCLGQPRFTLKESAFILQYMTASGYKSTSEFLHDFLVKATYGKLPDSSDPEKTESAPPPLQNAAESPPGGSGDDKSLYLCHH